MPNNTAKQPKAGPPQFLLDAISAINKGCHDKAIEIFKKNIEHNRFAAYCGIGDIYRAKGDYQEALKWLKKAQQHNPDAPNVVESIFIILTKLNQNDQAEKLIYNALKRQKNPKAIRSLADALRKQGKGSIAAEAMEKIIEDNTKNLDMIFETAFLYDRMGKYDKAELYYKKILAVVPHAITYDRLGCLYLKTEQMAQAVQCLRKAVELMPEHNGIRNDLANILIKAGYVNEGAQILRKTIETAAIDPTIHSTYLYHLHMIPGMDMQSIFDAHLQWGRKHAPVSLACTSHKNIPDPHRKLRIGYISPDFRRHSVAFIFEALLKAHNRENFEFYGYGNVEQPDDFTDRFTKMFYRYRNIFEIDDQRTAGIITEDQIDILVDLAGHTTNHRLGVLARKPAPVQVSCLGYFDTTGMPQVDYIITDQMLNPPETQKYYTEKLAYLPGGICYYRPLTSPEITPLPMLRNGYITFGTYTNNLRFNNMLFETWAEILKRLPKARLVMGFPGGEDKAVQEQYIRQFENLGLSKDVLTLTGRKMYLEYLKQYESIDIALDTFPENGGTTTNDAMWMGCPVISKYEMHMNGRVGLAILNSIGMGQYAVPTVEEYVAKAVELAGNPEKLADLRKTLRQKMKDSPLCNAGRYAKEFEAAYRKMWFDWCQKQSVTV
jgi:protein O-GlcNAc transferase